MMTTATTAESVRWKARLTRTHDRLSDAVSAFQDGELDWAPDTGIDHARGILWGLALRERSLVRRLEEREDSSASRPATVPDVDECLRLLESTRGRLEMWLDCVDEAGLESSLEDLICEHLFAMTEGVARLRSLVQLIDPSRVTSRHWIAATP